MRIKCSEEMAGMEKRIIPQQQVILRGGKMKLNRRIRGMLALLLVFLCPVENTGEFEVTVTADQSNSAIYGDIVVYEGQKKWQQGYLWVRLINKRGVPNSKIRDSIHLGDSQISALALSDGMLFVGQENGKITCFERSVPVRRILFIPITVIPLLATTVIILSYYS